MKYLDEYGSPKLRYMNINISLIFKILFSDNPLEIVFYCENSNYVEQLSNLLKKEQLSEKANIKFVIATENFKGSKPDLNIVIGDFNEEAMDRIYPCATTGMIWFKDSRDFIEYFENFKKQDKIKLKFENGKGYEVY